MTWSILARDPSTGEVGVAVTTRNFAVGMLCPATLGGVGAAASQALANPLIAPDSLARLAAGEAPDEALAALLAADAGRDQRQCHLLGADGRSARHTGPGCIPWAGHDSAEGVSVAGNMLAGPEVLAATLEAFLATAGRRLSERLILALEAGQAAGGDKRGRQSAALQVSSRDPYPDLDLRVDDHPDPLSELRRLHGVALRRFVHFRGFLPGRDHPGVLDRAVIERAIAARQGRG
jgi:uncharacterized Ntn-hydrolase superfamily protein